VGIDKGITEVIRPKVFIQSGEPAQFRREKPLRRPAKTGTVGRDSHLKLGLNCFGKIGVHRQKGIGRGGGEQLYAALLLIIIKNLEEVPLIPFGKKYAPIHSPIVKKLRQSAQFRVIPGTLLFPDAEFYLPVYIGKVAFKEQLIFHHMTEDRGKGNAHTEGNMIPVKTIKDFQQGDIGIGKGFKEPLLLKGPGQPAVTDKRQMGIEQN
jgi:hypothetical protein